MSTLKLTLAASLVAVAAIVSIHATEGLSTPPSAAPTSKEMTASCHSGSHSHTSAKAAGPVIGSPRDLSNQSPSNASGSRSDSLGHCSMKTKDKASMSCCK